MKLLDIQRRHQEIGRIRSGISEEAVSRRTGKTFKQPKKLDTFVLSSPNRAVIEAAAALYTVNGEGGDVEAWEGQWRVITPVNQLPCSIPGADAALNQAWETWSGGVCVRRCDGVTEQLRQVPCLCPSDGLVRADLAGRGEACKAKTRINVILPDLPGVGVWRLETGSWNAAVETSGTIELLAAARDGAGIVIPAVLRLERRESKRLVDAGVRPDPRKGIKGERAEAREFYVPVIDVLATPRELTELASRPLAAALPPPPTELRAIAAAPVREPVREPVTAPAGWAQTPPAPAREAAPEAAAGAGASERPPAPATPSTGVPKVSRDPQTIADASAAATDAETIRELWREASAAGVLDAHVSLDSTLDDAPYDVLQVVLEERGAALAEGR